jgi:hypothetical protein
MVVMTMVMVVTMMVMMTMMVVTVMAVSRRGPRRERRSTERDSSGDSEQGSPVKHERSFVGFGEPSNPLVRPVQRYVQADRLNFMSFIGRS